MVGGVIDDALVGLVGDDVFDIVHGKLGSLHGLARSLRHHPGSEAEHLPPVHLDEMLAIINRLIAGG